MEAGLLAHFQRQQLAAKEARQRKEREREVVAKQAREAEAAADRERAHAEATRMLRLNASNRRSSTTSASASRKPGESSNRSRSSAGSPAQKRTSRNGSRSGPRSGRVEKSKKKKPTKPRHDPTKPLPGMEFVERRHKPKKAIVPNTMDYSDLFPEQIEFCDMDALRKTFEATAAAAEYNKKLVEERKELYNEFLKNAALDKKDNGRRVSDSNWVAVPASVALATAAKRGKAFNSSSSRETRFSPPKNVSKKLQKEEQQKRKIAETASKVDELRMSIMRATGGAPEVQSKSPPKLDSSKRSASEVRSKVKRRHSVSDEEEEEGEEEEEEEDYRTRKFRRQESSRRSRHSRRDSSRRRSPEYDSAGYGDSDEDEEEEEDFGTGFEDLMAEEERSSRYAAMEDRRELKRLMKAKKEKEHRRREWEKKYG